MEEWIVRKESKVGKKVVYEVRNKSGWYRMLSFNREVILG